jgi:hypothetical protein
VNRTTRRALAAAGGLLLLALAGWWWLRPAAPHPDAARFTAPLSAQPFLQGLNSNDSVEQVRAVLQAAGYRVRAEAARRVPSADYPPWRMDTLTVYEYRHLEDSGQLRLEFFNDRLYEAEYQPGDAASYAPRLLRAVPGLVRQPQGRRERLSANLRVATNVELVANAVGQALGATPYVIWQDRRLLAQREEWDARFGAAPFVEAD